MNLKGIFKSLRWWQKFFIVWIGITLLWNHLPYHFDPDGAADYATAHARKKSKSWCAGYVMQAMVLGSKCPMGLLPAYAYAQTLPQMGFEEVATEKNKDFKPTKGDIVVLPNNELHPFGHIAIFNGEQWVSDFKQNGIYPSRAYKKTAKYQVFRAEKGWHWKHVWTHPGQWWGWIKSVAKGWLKL